VTLTSKREYCASDGCTASRKVVFAPAATVPKFSQAQAVPLLGDSVQLSACVSARVPAAAHSAAARRSAPLRRRLPAMLPHLRLSTLAGMK